tara:strand:- start:1299 stop:2504 length:1206 start_codon:yes stop_codon:yes gene_type:complete
MPRITETEDGKYEVNGLIFHNTHMDKIKSVENPLGGLSYVKRKTDLATRFKTYFMDYKYPKLDLEKLFGYTNLSYDEEAKLQTDFIIELGFVSKDIQTWPYHSWTHKLKLEDLKDLFIQTFENDFGEDLKKYNKYLIDVNEYNEDLRNRGILAKGIEEFLAFQSAFKNRRTAMEELVQRVELGIGKGNYLNLALSCEDTNNWGFEYIPKECKINSFEAMAYAKEWLRIFQPAIQELSTLESVLNVPYELSANLNGIPAEQLRDINLYTLTEFRYQDFLTYLMDFKNRFGIQNDYAESNHLTGWNFFNYNQNGDYVNRDNLEAAKWNIFDCPKDHYRSSYGTWGQWLNRKALSGEIEALSDPDRLRDIVRRTNLSKHLNNEKCESYERPMILVNKVEQNREA